MNAIVRLTSCLAVYLFPFALLVNSAMAVPVTDNLVGYWQFNGNWNDATIGARHLSNVGSVSFDSGLLGQSLRFTGSPASFAARSVSDSAFNFGGSDYTIQTWANFENTVHREQTLIEKFDGPAGPGWTLTKPGSPSTGDTYHYFAGSGGSLTVGVGIPGLTWHHLVVRKSGGTLQLYNDNGLIASQAGSSVPSSSAPLLLGRRSGSQEFPFLGRLDEVAIWNRALTPEEIGALYNGGSGRSLVDLPTITSATQNGTSGNITINEGQSVALQMSASDPTLGENISFTINGTSAGSVGNFGTSSVVNTVFADDGVFSNTFVAKDAFEQQVSTALQVTVQNVAPSITAFPDDLQLFGIGPLMFSAAATDPGITDILTFDWDLNGDSLFDDFTGANVNHFFDMAGKFQIGLRVSDGDGGEAFDSFLLTVAPEPSAAVLCLTGLLAFVGARPRRITARRALLRAGKS